jgi:hypothetical protein
MGLHSRPGARPDHPLRLVMISITPHVRRGGARGKFAGPANQGTLVLATNLLDVPAEIIALIYQYRWSIEVFFRFFKQILRRASPPPRLPSPAEHQAAGRADPDVLRDHRLLVDQPMDGKQADQAHGGNAGVLLHGCGQRRRGAASYRWTEKSERLTRRVDSQSDRVGLDAARIAPLHPARILAPH